MGIQDSYPNTWNPIGPHGGRKTEDYESVLIDAGKLFRGGLYDSDIDNGSSMSIMITAGTNAAVVFFQTEATGEGVSEIFKSPVASAGSAVSMKNANFGSTNTSDLTVVSDPTIATVGTRICASPIGSTGKFSQSGGAALCDEWKLEPGASYLYRFSCLADDTQAIVKIVSEEDF